MGKVLQLKTLFFPKVGLHSRKLELKMWWWSKRAGFSTEVAALQQWGRIAAPAHPGSPGL